MLLLHYLLFVFYSIKAVSRVAETGRICILDIDSEGVKSIKKTNLNPRYIFIEPPSIACLVSKLLLYIYGWVGNSF